MSNKSDTLNMLTELHAEVRPIFESHLPESYAKDEALFCLAMAFDNAKEAVNESEN